VAGIYKVPRSQIKEWKKDIYSRGGRIRWSLYPATDAVIKKYGSRIQEARFGSPQQTPSYVIGSKGTHVVKGYTDTATGEYKSVQQIRSGSVKTKEVKEDFHPFRTAEIKAKFGEGRRIPTREEAKKLHPSIVRASTKEEMGTDKWFNRPRRLGMEVEQQSGRETGSKKILYGLAATGFGAASSVIDVGKALTHPVESVKSLYRTAKDPFGAGAMIGKEIKTRPAFAGGYIAGSVGIVKAPLGRLAGKALKKVPVRLKTTIFRKISKPKSIDPTPLLEKEAFRTSRQRVTLLLKEPKSGKYVLGQTKTGKAISIGGGVEKGQTLKTALKSELLQETGLKLTDLKRVKKFGKYVTPEETFHIFTAEVSKKTISRIKPSSDIAGGLKYVSPKQITKFGGRTFKDPFSKGGVRSYELQMMKWVETGQKPKWLVTEAPSFGKYGYTDTFLKPSQNVLKHTSRTKTGRFQKFGELIYLGDKSRYNVPYKSQVRALAGSTKKPVLLTHATPSGWKSLFSQYKTRKFTIQKGKNVRGVGGLYTHPPVSTKSGLGYTGLSYLEFGAGDYALGTKFSWFKKRVIFTTKSKLGKTVTATKKTRAGTEFERLIRPNTIIETTKGKKGINILNELVDVQPVKLVTVSKSKATRFNLLTKEFYSKSTSLKRKSAIADILKKETGVEYGRYKIITPKDIAFAAVKPAAYEPKTALYKPKVYGYPVGGKYPRVGAYSKSNNYAVKTKYQLKYTPKEILKPRYNLKSLYSPKAYISRRPSYVKPVSYAYPKSAYGTGYKQIPRSFVPPPPRVLAPPKFGAGEKYKSGLKLAPRKYGYKASLAALIFGIKGKKLKKGRYTGLELRPISR